MYFPFFILHGWRKRSAIQPQTIYSEFPYKKKETLAPRGKILRDASVSQLCLVYSRKSPKINW